MGDGNHRSNAGDVLMRLVLAHAAGFVGTLRAQQTIRCQVRISSGMTFSGGSLAGVCLCDTIPVASGLLRENHGTNRRVVVGKFLFYGKHSWTGKSMETIIQWERSFGLARLLQTT